MVESTLATYSMTDLKLLLDALAAIKPSAEGSSESMKLYKACERLCMIVQHAVTRSTDPSSSQSSQTVPSTQLETGFLEPGAQVVDNSVDMSGMMPLSHGDWEQMLREFEFDVVPGGASELANYFRAP